MVESEANVIQVKIGDYFVRLELPEDPDEAWRFIEPDNWDEVGSRFRRAARQRQRVIQADG